MVAATASNTKIASSIHGFHAFDKPVDVVELSKGMLIDLNDEDIAEASKDLLRDGVIAEPASAASVAALKHMDLHEDIIVCCVITGNGMKYPKALQTVFSNV